MARADEASNFIFMKHILTIIFGTLILSPASPENIFYLISFEYKIFIYNFSGEKKPFGTTPPERGIGSSKEDRDCFRKGAEGESPRLQRELSLEEPRNFNNYRRFKKNRRYQEHQSSVHWPTAAWSDNLYAQQFLLSDQRSRSYPRFLSFALTKSNPFKWYSNYWKWSWELNWHCRWGRPICQRAIRSIGRWLGGRIGGIGRLEDSIGGNRTNPSCDLSHFCGKTPSRNITRELVFTSAQWLPDASEKSNRTLKRFSSVFAFSNFIDHFNLSSLKLIFAL